MQRSSLGAFTRSALAARNAAPFEAEEVPYVCWLDGSQSGRMRLTGFLDCAFTGTSAWVTTLLDTLPGPPPSERDCFFLAGTYNIHPALLFQERLEFSSGLVGREGELRYYCQPFGPTAGAAVDCDDPNNNIHGELMAVAGVEIDPQQFGVLDPGTNDPAVGPCPPAFTVVTRWDVVLYYCPVTGAAGINSGEYAWFMTIVGYVVGPADADTGQPGPMTVQIGSLGTWRLSTEVSCEASVLDGDAYVARTIADPWTGTWVRVEAADHMQPGGPVDLLTGDDPPGMQEIALCSSASSWGNYLETQGCCSAGEHGIEVTPCAFTSVSANVAGVGDACDGVIGSGLPDHLAVLLNGATLTPIDTAIDTSLTLYRVVHNPSAGTTVTWLLAPEDEYVSAAWRLTVRVVAAWGTLLVSWLQVAGSGSCGHGLWHPSAGRYEYEGHEATPADACFAAALAPSIVTVSA